MAAHGEGVSECESFERKHLLVGLTGTRMSTQLQNIATQAKLDKKRRFRSLYRLLNKENMAATFKKLRNKRSAVGIDGQSYANFETCLAENCQTLEDALKEKRYSAPAIRRVNIPKPDGRKRPLGITTISDKVVQAPVSAILSAIYGSQFKEFNFGYRPKLGAHQALDYLRKGLYRSKGWVVEMDIEGFFDNINHDWLMKMLKLRIDDEPFLRLIGKWLNAKVVEEGGKITSPRRDARRVGLSVRCFPTFIFTMC